MKDARAVPKTALQSTRKMTPSVRETPVLLTDGHYQEFMFYIIPVSNACQRLGTAIKATEPSRRRMRTMELARDISFPS